MRDDDVSRIHESAIDGSSVVEIIDELFVSGQQSSYVSYAAVAVVDIADRHFVIEVLEDIRHIEHDLVVRIIEFRPCSKICRDASSLIGYQSEYAIVVPAVAGGIESSRYRETIVCRILISQDLQGIFVDRPQSLASLRIEIYPSDLFRAFLRIHIPYRAYVHGDRIYGFGRQPEKASSEIIPWRHEMHR